MPDRPIMVICAWCGALLGEGSAPASHGICPDCLAKLEAEIPEGVTRA